MYYSGWLVPARAGVISERLGKHEAVKRRYYRWIEMDVLMCWTQCSKLLPAKPTWRHGMADG
jgi:hypothetical protein